MAGIYIHIPFCKKKCAYCDFYSIGLTGDSVIFSNLLSKELELRKNFLGNNSIESIYFGGGTPSVLNTDIVGALINSIFSNYDVANKPEITIEVNPDDVDKKLLMDYLHYGINRISIGIQSLDDTELKFLGRRHNSTQAIDSVKLAQDVGFSNISIDLIYGIPNSTLRSWETSLTNALMLEVHHLSCYHLTFEEGTPFFRNMEKKDISPISETLSLEQYQLLREYSNDAGFIHYEISNFAKEGYYSKHNSSYWKGLPYLGVGPSAHSFRPFERLWNPKSFTEWKKGIETSNLKLEGEVLDIKTQFNELLLTRLRTIYGISINEIQNSFGQAYLNLFLKNSNSYIDKGFIVVENNSYRIPAMHYFISDTIVSDLMVV